MSMQNRLAKMMLLLPLSILAACAGGDKGGPPSLNADDIWDQMAEERQKPLPVYSQAADSDEMLPERPFDAPTGPLTTKDIAAYRSTLSVAAAEYKSIVTTLDANFIVLAQGEATTDARKVQWRTVQLYLSRLINLQHNLTMAMDALGDDAPALVFENADILAVMAEQIARTRTRLDEFIPPMNKLNE